MTQANHHPDPDASSRYVPLEEPGAFADPPTGAYEAAPTEFGEGSGGEAYGGQASGSGGDLSVFDDEYEAAEAPSFEEVPDGKYQVRVHRVELGKSQAGDPMLKWDLIVLSGPMAGRHVFKNSVITQKSLPFVKGDLQTLGVVLPRFSELPAHLDELLDRSLQITRRTRGDYSNVYFNHRLDLPLAAGGPALPDEPAPF